MSLPFYVNPETATREKADFARRNIARGRPIVALEVTEGVLIVSENPSRHLRKIAEVYDRIAFAGVGKYTELEALRKAGVRLADMKGYSYHREDVTARSLANAYAETMAAVFTNDLKPYEVEIMVAQVGESVGEANEIYHVDFAGFITDEHRFMAMGGEAEALRERVAEAYRDDFDLNTGLRAAVEALGGPDRQVPQEELEAALLESAGGRRRFRRLTAPDLADALG